MGKFDCLFLHIPKLANYYRPLNRFLWGPSLPVHLLALADLLQRNGITSQVIHLGVEQIEDKNFSILSYLHEQRPKIVALDLHWHPQSYDVIEAVKEIKAAFPQIYTLLGGFTASFFHEEIMRNFDAVDGIIRGEAENPLSELANTLLQGRGDLFSIPNLTWRRKGRILINPLSYVASEHDLNNLSFTNFPLLKNYTTYLRAMGQPFHGKRIPGGKHFWLDSLNSPIFHLPVGRGCPVQCTWCSSSYRSQETLSGRREPTFRGAVEVLRSIREASPYGYEIFHIAFDPYPQSPGYFLDLFTRIREEKLRVECLFESSGLPQTHFIKAFKETFPGTKSLIALSPDVGSGRLRKIHKGYPYTNQALFDCLDKLEQHHVFFDLSFTLGLPFETEEDVHQTIRLQKQIRSRYSHARAIRTFTLTVEPGSPWHLDPETFGVKTSLQNFMDFYHYHSGAGTAFSSLGYWIPNYFREVEDAAGFEKALQRIRGRLLGYFQPDLRYSFSPVGARRFCDLSRLFWRAKERIGKKS